jgi:hypothetical protein
MPWREIINRGAFDPETVEMLCEALREASKQGGARPGRKNFMQIGQTPKHFPHTWGSVVITDEPNKKRGVI